MTDKPESWRPHTSPNVGLSDADLSRIGMIAILEASAKTMCAAVCKVVQKLSHHQWAKLDAITMKDLVSKTRKAVTDGDARLFYHMVELEKSLIRFYPIRDMVVHNVWGYEIQPREVSTFGYHRQIVVSRDIIEEALTECADMRSIAYLAVYRTAELIQAGVYLEGKRGDGGTLIMRTNSGSVRL